MNHLTVQEKSTFLSMQIFLLNLTLTRWVECQWDLLNKFASHLQVRLLLWDHLSGLVTFTRRRWIYGRALSFTLRIFCTLFSSYKQKIRGKGKLATPPYSRDSGNDFGRFSVLWYPTKKQLHSWSFLLETTQSKACF